MSQNHCSKRVMPMDILKDMQFATYVIYILSEEESDFGMVTLHSLISPIFFK